MFASPMLAPVRTFANRVPRVSCIVGRYAGLTRSQSSSSAPVLSGITRRTTHDERMSVRTLCNVVNPQMVASNEHRMRCVCANVCSLDNPIDVAGFTSRSRDSTAVGRGGLHTKRDHRQQAYCRTGQVYDVVIDTSDASRVDGCRAAVVDSRLGQDITGRTAAPFLDQFTEQAIGQRTSQPGYNDSWSDPQRPRPSVRDPYNSDRHDADRDSAAERRQRPSRRHSARRAGWDGSTGPRESRYALRAGAKFGRPGIGRRCRQRASSQ